jgi:hypothetical protein
MLLNNSKKLMSVAIVAIASAGLMQAAIALPTTNQSERLISQQTETPETSSESSLVLEPTAGPGIGAMRGRIAHVTPNYSAIRVETEDGETHYLKVARGEGIKELNAGDERVFLIRRADRAVMRIMSLEDYTAYSEGESTEAEEARAAVRARYEEIRSRQSTRQETTVQRQETAPPQQLRPAQAEPAPAAQPVRALW